mgnify:CR=1 FL=1
MPIGVDGAVRDVVIEHPLPVVAEDPDQSQPIAETLDRVAEGSVVPQRDDTLAVVEAVRQVARPFVPICKTLRAHPPRPSASNLGVAEGEIVHEACWQSLTVLHQPLVDCRHVALMEWAICCSRHALGMRRDGAPEVANEAVEVVDGLGPGPRRGPREQHGSRAEEGLYVILHGPEPFPDHRRNPTLPAEPREGSDQLIRH